MTEAEIREFGRRVAQAVRSECAETADAADCGYGVAAPVWTLDVDAIADRVPLKEQKA